jgi:membrane protease YdiL (CAAX protease family)
MGESNSGRPVIGVVAYLVLSFGIAWGFWALLLPASATGNLSRFEIFALPGAFAPAIACFIVRRWITREGFADAGLGLHLRRWPYYLAGWFLPFAVVAFLVAAAEIMGIAKPDLAGASALASLAPHAQVPPALARNLWLILPAQAAVIALIATPVLFGEEFGWRGYLQLRLFPGRPTLAAIATGIIWGLWHLPVILRGYEMQGDPVPVTAVFCGGAVLISIVFGWLRERSGSVWATSLAHSATNAIGGSLTLLYFSLQAKGLLLGYIGMLSWIPLGLLCIWIVASGANRKRA